MSQHTEQDYDILSTIAENDKTKVYLASSAMSTDPIIVKVLKNSDMQIVQKIASLDSPFLPRILHVEDDTVFEEYIAGDTLDKYVKEHTSSEEEIVTLLLQICSGLRTLHTQNPPIIHRDLKPSNILVTEKDGEPLVKIIDFDASREYNPEKSRDTRALGTDTYAPPEQFGYSQTDVRSDIYSLGCVIDEITTGMDIDQGLRAIVSKATMFNPDQRYQNVDELTRVLLTYKRKKIGLFPIIAALVSVVALGVGAFLLINMNKENKALSSSLDMLEDKVSDMAVSSQAVSAAAAQAASEGAVKAAPADAETEDATKQITPTVTIDSFDEKTKKSVRWVFYYLTEQPELSPFAVKTMGATGDVAGVRIGTEVDPSGNAIDSRYWSQDSDGFLHIEDEYLQTLEKNTCYTVTADWPKLRLIFDLMCIDDLTIASGVDPVLNPGYSEFIKKDPKDMVFHTANAFGKKLIYLKNDDTGKKLSKKEYTFDEKSGTVTISQDYLNKYKDGEYVNISCMFDEIETGVTICVRDVPYIMPELAKTAFVMHESDDDDIKVGITFNSAKGKLEDVFVSDKNKPDEDPQTLKKKHYKVAEDYIRLKGSYLKKLKKGEYKVAFEFGDVARTISLTVV